MPIEHRVRLPDYSTLTPVQYSLVRKVAERALRDAGALGIFPTPIANIMDVARVQEVKEDVLNESFIQKLRTKMSGAGSLVRTALSKVLGLFHASEGLIFIDRTLMEVKKQFVRLHECAHGYLPWQRGMYAVVEDCEKSLDPDVADAFDREANVFASEVLFQLDAFHLEARDHAFSIFTPVKLSKKFGASIYSTVRQYVSKSDKCCAVIVLNPPEIAPGAGFQCALRRVIVSPSFATTFGQVGWPERFGPDDQVGAMVPIGSRKSSGKRTILLRDANGNERGCVAESFTQGYQVFVLVLLDPKPKAREIVLPW